MGTSKRYAAHFDRLGEESHIDRLAQAAPLQTLTPREIGLDVLPLTIAPRPDPVVAWVRFGAEPCRVRATVARWTDLAVGIEFSAREKVYRCWVWRSAVSAPE